MRLIVEGQQVAGQQRRLTIAPGSEASVVLAHRASADRIQEVTVEADLPADLQTVDNVAHAIVKTRTAPRVLLVESSAAAPLPQRRTYFVAAALTPPPDMPAWVDARTVAADQLTQEDVQAADVIVLPDVDRLPQGAADWLTAAVREGAGLLIANGPHTTAEFFEQTFCQSGLLPRLRLDQQRTVDPDRGSMQVLAASLQADWLQAFRDRPDTSFLNAVFQTWWDVRIGSSAEPNITDDSTDNAAAHPVIRLTNRAPLLLERRCGRGRILVLTTPLDTAWSNLPGRPDVVAFLY